MLAAIRSHLAKTRLLALAFMPSRPRSFPQVKKCESNSNCQKCPRSRRQNHDVYKTGCHPRWRPPTTQECLAPRAFPVETPARFPSVPCPRATRGLRGALQPPPPRLAHRDERGSDSHTTRIVSASLQSCTIARHASARRAAGTEAPRACRPARANGRGCAVGEEGSSPARVRGQRALSVPPVARRLRASTSQAQRRLAT